LFFNAQIVFNAQKGLGGTVPAQAKYLFLPNLFSPIDYTRIGPAVMRKKMLPGT